MSERCYQYMLAKYSEGFLFIKVMEIIGSSKDAYKQIGSEVSHFLAGVYCSPPSICSHIVNLSQTPELLSKGTPSTKWNMMYVACHYHKYPCSISDDDKVEYYSKKSSNRPRQRTGESTKDKNKNRVSLPTNNLARLSSMMYLVLFQVCYLRVSSLLRWVRCEWAMRLKREESRDQLHTRISIMLEYDTALYTKRVQWWTHTKVCYNSRLTTLVCYLLTLIIDPICIQISHCRLIQSIIVILLDFMHRKDRGRSASFSGRCWGTITTTRYCITK